MTVPATVGLIVLRVPIVRVLFQGGRFGAADTAATAGVLATLAAGLFFFAGVRVLVPAFYALKDTTLPVLAALADAAAFVALCALLTRPLGLPGIGLAASAAAAVNVADPHGRAAAAGGAAPRAARPGGLARAHHRGLGGDGRRCCGPPSGCVDLERIAGWQAARGS